MITHSRSFAALALIAMATAAANAASESPSASAPSKGVWETGHFSFLPRAFQSDPRIDVILHTDITEAGVKAPQASVEHPIYYTGSDGGNITVGQSIGGETPPPASELAQILVRSLHEGGFLPTDAAHPPTVFIHYRWGSFNRLQPLGGRPDDLDLANLLERAALVGGAHFAYEMLESINAGTLGFFEDSSPRINFLVQEAHDDRYFIIASGYDYAAAKKGIVRLLWSTKISTNSRGITMDESLPQLVASAGAYIGHPTEGPVRLNRPVVKPGHVDIGTPTVKEDLPPDEATQPATPSPSGAP